MSLKKLIKKAKRYKMTPEERAAQRRSWVIGEMMLEHPEMTRAQTEELVDYVLGPGRYIPPGTLA